MSKAIYIDADQHQISYVMIRNFRDIQRLVSGSEGNPFTSATELPNGDIVMVDDEGLLKATRSFITLKGIPQPLAGNGLVVGPDDPETGESMDVRSSIPEIEAIVGWMNRAQADAWAKANADRPSTSFTVMGDRGPETVVLETYGNLFANMPQPDKEH